MEIKVINEPEDLNEAICCRFTYYYQYYAPPTGVVIEESENKA